jgi:transposase
MLTFPPSVHVFVATQPVDGRKGAYSLAAMVRSVFGQDVLDGSMYVFFSRRSDSVRVLYWDRAGFALWSKHLEAGRFRPPRSGDGAVRASEIEYAELALILEGIELAESRRRRRWVPQKPADSALRKIAARALPARTST